MTTGRGSHIERLIRIFVVDAIYFRASAEGTSEWEPASPYLLTVRGWLLMNSLKHLFTLSFIASALMEKSIQFCDHRYHHFMGAG